MLNPPYTGLPPQPHRFRSVDVRGLAIAECTLDDIERVIVDAVLLKQRCRIATINLDFLRLAAEDAELQNILDRFEYRVADGWPIIELAKIKGHHLPERVTGADLVPRIMNWAHQRNWRIGMVGGSEATRSAIQSNAAWSSVIKGYWTPYYGNGTLADPELAADIRSRNIDVLLVALGCPKQERWIDYNLAGTGAPVAMGIGAALDFLAQTKSRAPKLIQNMKLEFAYRMLCEPRRLCMRYVRDFLFYRQALMEARLTTRQHTLPPNAAPA